MKLKSKIDKILPHVSKPSRYISGEINSIIKEQEDIDFRVALAFPDSYEIGMSHIGISILYEIVNNLDKVQAERVFAPWIDMVDKMKDEEIPLFSYETLTPINKFDLLGFSLQYELCYTNVLMMLDLADIPLLSQERTDIDPIVIAGGPCVFNPEPMVDFIDAFVIGDAEDAIVEIVESLRNISQNREEKLQALHKIDGVYVPQFYETKTLENGTVVVKNAKIKKRFVTDLDSAVYPTKQIIPYMPAIHDTSKIEVLRGCTQGCRFCQAGIIYRPVRERSLETIDNIIKESIQNTGYEELSLVSLSTCDYSRIYDLVKQTVDIAAPEHIGVSFPSSRVDSFSIDLADMVQSIRKTGLTFAPEAGTEELRLKINKPISNSELLSKCEKIYASGWDLIKLYFMIGFPMETDEDVEAIGKLAQEIIGIGRRNNKRANLNLSVSTFIPKPHTPFQWYRQISIEETERKQKILRKEVRNRRISFKPHDAYISFLEGVFSRGDRRLGKVILQAYRLGCRFDAWTEQFKFEEWMEAFDKCNNDPEEYLRERVLDEPLPWEHIDTLVTKEFLLDELKRSSNGELSLDCRKYGCNRCGINQYWADCVTKTAALSSQIKDARNTVNDEDYNLSDTESDIAESQKSVQKIRIQYSKTELLRFLSHLEIMKVITRSLRRQNIPVAFSGGYHPLPKISFSSPTSVGITSMAEFVDIEMYSEMNPNIFMNLLNEALPDKLEVLEVREIPLKAPSLTSEIEFSKYRIHIPNKISKEKEEILSRLESIMDLEELWIVRVRGNKSKKVNLRKQIKEIQFIETNPEETILESVLKDGSSGKGRPEEVVGFLLDISHSEVDKLLDLKIIKTDSYIPNEQRLVSPML